MKKLYFLLFSFLIGPFLFGQSVFINEIHYDNTGGDVNEGIEIAGPAGTDLSTYTLTPYNGNGGVMYSVTPLSGSIPNEGGTGYGAVFFAISGLQNGAPDGIALDNGGSLIQFLSYEGAFTATDGPANGMMSTDIGVSESGAGAVGNSLQLTGTGTDYTNFFWSGETTSSYGFINAGQTFGAASPSINITSPTDATVYPPGTNSVNVEWSTANLGGGETVDITVNGSTTNNVTSPFAVATSDGQTYNITVELIDGGVVDSDMISFSVSDIINVFDLGALRSDVITNGIGRYYQIASNPTITYARVSRNQKYVQDVTGGILIDDNAGTITTSFVAGDGMSGLVGQTVDFNGVLEFVPLQDASVVAGATITPEVITIASLLANQEDYESELVRINGVTFTDAGMSFAASANYDISDGSTTVFRTNFSEANYIGQTIPAGSNDMIVLVGEFNGTAQVTARSLSELTLSVENNRIDGFIFTPNPTSLGYVKISSKSQSIMSVGIYDILGKQVISKTVENSRLDVSTLTSGIYIMKISQDDATTTKKLVIR